MKKNYTAPQAELTCFEPWESVALVDLNGDNGIGGGISFSDLWAAANKGASGEAVKLPGDISIPL